MPRTVGEPITKITTNIFTSDLEWFKKRYGQGWSEVLRQAIRSYIASVKRAEQEVIQHTFLESDD